MKISKDTILDKTNQGLDIFKHYIPELNKYGSKKNFRAIFRNDGKNPDANVFFNKQSNIWYYKDFVVGESLSPFDFVMKIENCDFKDSLETINSKILMNGSGFRKLKEPHSETSSFQIEESMDYDYWFEFAHENAMKMVLEQFQVKAISSYTIHKGKKEFKISAIPEDPIFAFKISDSCFKIYRPHATGKQSKHLWLGEKPGSYNDLFGIDQLPEYSEYIIIVEGLKDAVVANANGIVALGVDHATTNLSDEDIALIRNKCKHLLICYDIDKPGLTASEKAASKHGLHRLQLPDKLIKTGGKDLSDFFFYGYTIDDFKQLAIEAANQEPLNKNEDDKPATEKTRLSQFERVENIISENYKLRFNEISNEFEFNDKNSDDEDYYVLNVDNVYRFLQHNNIKFSMANLTSMLRSDFVPWFNPFNLYFESLPSYNPATDSDYISELTNYLPVKDLERLNTQFRKALVRTVACALRKDVINKQAFLIIHDEQNSGKSTFIRWLCPPELSKYITESISTDKDGLISISDNFIINLDELATLSKAEINSLKSIFSKETVKVRRPYDRTTSSAPRRVSFFGSTNKSEFLTDETGSVRWICFELIDKINWDYKKDINIDNIWRQAYHLFTTGFPFDLTADEIKENHIINLQFQMTTPELEMLQQNYLPGTKENNNGFYQATDFLRFLLDKNPSVRLNLNNIGKALKLLGFERTCQRTDKQPYPIKGYYFLYKN